MNDKNDLIEQFPKKSVSLRARVTLFSLGIALVCLWSMSYLAIRSLRQDATHLIIDHQRATAAMLTRQIDRDVEVRLERLSNVARIAAPLMEKGATKLQPFLEQRFGLQKMFNGGIFIVGNDGIRSASVPFFSTRIGTDLNDRDYVQNALRHAKPSVGKPIIARPFDSPVVVMAVPIIEEGSGKTLGLLAGVTDLSSPSFLEQVSEGLFGRTGGYLLLSRADRTVIAASEKGKILHKLPEAGQDHFWDQVSDGVHLSGVYVNALGEEAIVSSQPTSFVDWALLVELPTAEAFSAIEAVKRFMLFSTIALTLIAGGLAWWIARRQLSPLRKAAQSLMCSLESGQLKPLPIERSDEIGTLIKGFNHALKTLGDREKSLQDSEERFRFLHDASFGGIMIQENGVILECNQALADLTGYSLQELVGMDGYRICSPESVAVIRENIASSTIGAYEVEGVRKDGSRFPLSIQGKAIPYKGRMVRAAELRDISERKLAEKAIHQLAFFDKLTELPNRQLLCDRIQHAMKTSARHLHQGAVLFFDIRHFQRINDTIGREAGDNLLRGVAQRITTNVRDGDTVARIGNDQFALLLEGLSESQDHSERRAEKVAEKILTAIQKPYDLNSAPVQCDFYVGIAMLEASLDAEAVISRAELAMVTAKSSGERPLCFYDPQMQARIVAQAALESDLRLARQYDQFQLYYQIQVDANGEAFGAEALLRWIHPEKGPISPATFIPIAEETGLIVSIGQWVLESACLQLSRWSCHPKMSQLTISVNVSARQFHQEDFVSQVLEALKRSKVSPNLLKLELTEGMLLSDVESVVNKMKELKSHGVGFSLDDFGTGYSSLSYLKRLPLDQLKIDQSFVRDIQNNLDDAAITRTIVALGQSLELDVIAEGVESASQRNFLEMLGCRKYQGYLFGRPVPGEEFSDMYLSRLKVSPVGH